MRALSRLVAGAALVALAGCGAPPSASDEADVEAPPADFVDDPVALPNGTQYTAVIAEGATPETLTRAAQEFCGAEEWCQLMAWQDANNVPRAMPMVQRESDSISFNYMINRASGAEVIGWDCRVWDGEPTDCIEPENSE